MGVNINNNPHGQFQPPSSSNQPAGSPLDPLQLLLLTTPDTERAKDVKAFNKEKQVQRDKIDNTVTAQEALKELADASGKSLISQPILQEGSKAALQRYIEQLTQQPQTGQQATSTDQGAAQTGQAATLAGQQTAGAPTQAGTGTPAAPQTPVPAGTPQAAGQPGTTPQATAQAATTPQTATSSLGIDPQVLQMNEPAVSQPLKDLGKLATTMASSQGGKLTQEQAALLTQTANDLFAATPSVLTDADKTVLMSFLAEVAQYPLTDDKNAPDSKNDTTSTSTSDSSSTQSSSQASTRTARNGKVPDPAQLQMDQLGLSDEVRQLGQQAFSYAQGNSGKLTQQETDQLKAAAEALINGGAEGDDLAALQNFLKLLVNFPKSAQQTGQTALLLTQSGIDPKLVSLAQFANAMLNGGNGALTDAEVATLKNMAENLMGELSPEDQAVLKTWLATLGNQKVTTPQPLNLFNESMLFGAKPASNPFLSPGIMAMLAPILSELLKINNDIIKQSSKLKQNMMALFENMAKEAFNFAIQAGQAKAQQLQLEAAKNFALGGAAIAGGLATFAASRFQKAQGQKSENEIKDKQSMAKMEKFAAGDMEATKPSSRIIQERKMDLKAAQQDVFKHGPDGKMETDTQGNPILKNPENGSASKQLSEAFAKRHNNRVDVNLNHNARTDMEAAHKDVFQHDANGTMVRDANGQPVLKNPAGGTKDEQLRSAFLSRQNESSDTKLTPDNVKEKFHTETTGEQLKRGQMVAQQQQTSGAAAATQMVGSASEALKGFIAGGFDMAKIPAVLEEARANAMSQMLSQLMQIVQQTISTASEDMQSAQKNWESFVQLIKDMSSAITQGIYRS